MAKPDFQENSRPGDQCGAFRGGPDGASPQIDSVVPSSPTRDTAQRVDVSPRGVAQTEVAKVDPAPSASEAQSHPTLPTGHAQHPVELDEGILAMLTPRERLIVTQDAEGTPERKNVETLPVGDRSTHVRLSDASITEHAGEEGVSGQEDNIAIIRKVVDDARVAATSNDPDDNPVDFYRRFAEQFPYHKPMDVYDALIVKIGETRDQADKVGEYQDAKGLLAMLSVQTVLSAVDFYAEFAQGDMDDMVQHALTEVYGNIDRLPGLKTPAATFVHRTATQAVQSYIRERDHRPSAWRSEGKEEAVEQAIDAMVASPTPGNSGPEVHDIYQVSTGLGVHYETFSDLLSFRSKYADPSAPSSERRGEYPPVPARTIEQVDDAIDVAVALDRVFPDSADRERRIVELVSGYAEGVPIPQTVVREEVAPDITKTRISQVNNHGKRLLRNSARLSQPTDTPPAHEPQARPVSTWQRIVVMRIEGIPDTEIAETLQMSPINVEKYVSPQRPQENEGSDEL